MTVDSALGFMTSYDRFMVFLQNPIMLVYHNDSQGSGMPFHIVVKCFVSCGNHSMTDAPVITLLWILTLLSQYFAFKCWRLSQLCCQKPINQFLAAKGRPNIIKPIVALIVSHQKMLSPRAMGF